ncbi:hypothetical protein Tco_0905268, partial [Tanacetum coccineum]
LRALPSLWNNVVLIMRNKDGTNDLDINDLYNNLKVSEADIKGYNSQGQASSSSYTDDLMFSFFANQSNSPQLDDEDLEECKAPRNQGNRNGDAWYRSRYNTRRTIPVETFDALVVQDNALIMQDGLGYDWSYIAQDEPTEFALMANSSSSKDKTGLGYVDQLDENDSSGSELFKSVFDSRSSDGDDNQNK